MAVPSNISDTGMQFLKPRTIIREESGLSSSIDELFNSVHNPGNAKPLKERKLPPSFFHPTTHQTFKNTINHSRDSSSDSTSGICSPTLQMKHALQAESTALCCNENANLMLQYIGQSHLITHSRAHSSPATLQANLQKASASELCTPLPLNISGNGMPIIYNKNFEDMTVQHQQMQSSPAITGINSWNSTAKNSIKFKKETAQTPSSQELQRYDQSNYTALQQQVMQAQQAHAAATLVAQLGPLPSGWEMAVNDSQQVYFIDHQQKRTQWTDPRLPTDVQHPCGYTLSALQEVHSRYRAMLVAQEEEKRRLQLIELAQQKENLRTRMEEVLTKESQLRHELAIAGGGAAAGVVVGSDVHIRQESSDSGLALEPVLTPPMMELNCKNLTMSPPDINSSGSNNYFLKIDADDLYPTFQEPLQNSADDWLQLRDVLPEDFVDFV